MFKKDLVLLESLLHVPLIISWPGQLDSRIVDDTFMESVDVMRFPDYEAFEVHHGKVPFNVPGDHNKRIRDRDYRYIWYGTGEEELYDLREDPGEAYNQAGDRSCADAKLRMKLRLLEWYALTEDPLDPLSIRQLQAEYGNWIGGRRYHGRTCLAR